jgi:cell division protein FtsZ
MKSITKIKVVGIGGSGCNAISRMRKVNISGIELIAINTDDQDLRKTKTDFKLRIGKNITQGLGTGMNPEIGRKAAQESKTEIKEILKDSDMIFITCGLGGGTGSGASPIVAEISKNLGALTVAIITRPFSFEGIYRRKIAENAERLLKGKVDSLIAIENDKLLEGLNSKISVSAAFWTCDDILRQAVQGITDLIFLPGIINVDFADVCSVMKNSGTALFGMGFAQGKDRASEATKRAINSPLLNISFKGAKGILFNVSGGDDLSLSEIDEVAKIITQEINPQAKVIFGALKDKNLKEGEIKVSVIATGF